MTFLKRKQFTALTLAVSLLLPLSTVTAPVETTTGAVSSCHGRCSVSQPFLRLIQPLADGVKVTKQGRERLVCVIFG